MNMNHYRCWHWHCHARSHLARHVCRPLIKRRNTYGDASEIKYNNTQTQAYIPLCKHGARTPGQMAAARRGGQDAEATLLAPGVTPPLAALGGPRHAAAFRSFASDEEEGAAEEEEGSRWSARSTR